MPRLKQTVQATTTVAVTVALKPNTRMMVRQRCEEYAKLSKIEKEAKERKKRISAEVDALFIKDKQGRALADGTELDGFKIKLVTGETSKLDTLALMKAHGLSQEDLDACTETTPNTAYVRITPPGKKERGGDSE